MQIFFIDESGTVPPPNKKHSKYFVLGGLSIPERHWHDINEELKQIKQKYDINHEIKWRYFAPNNKDEENTIRHLSVEQKESLRKELFCNITKYKSVKIISVVTNVDSAYQTSYIKTIDDLYANSYKRLTERFQYYLQDLSRTVGDKVNGIIVCDHRGPQDDQKLRKVHASLIESNADVYSSYQNIIEGLFIAPSDMSTGIQYADMIAGAVYRKFENNDDKYFNLIKDSIRKNPNTGSLDGYGIIKNPKQTWN